MRESHRLAIVILRVAVAALLIIHGVSRLRLGLVDDFGSFLAARGLPFGPALAWTITVVEIAGGLALAAGRLVIPLCLWFIVELAAGLALVHYPEGWFVVGSGRNGMEYSALLIAALASIAVANRRGARARSTGPVPRRRSRRPRR
jgi:putative oxidoreductase